MYEVVVGGIVSVCKTNDRQAAIGHYREQVGLSKQGKGAPARKRVVLYHGRRAVSRFVPAPIGMYHN